jgi:hypothetical protein
LSLEGEIRARSFKVRSDDVIYSSMSNEEVPFGYALSQRIDNAWYANDLIGLVLYGGWNIGKSAYALKVLMDLNRDPKGLKLDDYKHFMTFKPEHFVSLNAWLLQRGIKARMEIWDDAGLWLFALDWSDPKVKGAIKFLNVAKTTTAGLVLTTPSPDMILKKALRIEGIHVGKVIKLRGKDDKWRRVKIYRNNIAVWGKRTVKQVMEDDFSKMLPDHVWEWYDPVRRSYAKEAIGLLVKAYGMDIDLDSAESVAQMFNMLQTALVLKPEIPA